MRRSTRALLVGAVLATPLFVVTWAVQAFTREGFLPAFHPMSLLSLGEGGWVQIADFVATGMLIIGGGIGLRRTLGGGRLANWASVSVLLMGIGLVVAGVFVTDAGAGFPVGAPAGAPEMSWHCSAHQAGFILTQLGFVAGAVLFTVHFARARQRGRALACGAALTAAVLVAALGAPDTLAIRLVLSATIELGLVSALALRELLEAGPARSTVDARTGQLTGR